MKRFKTILVHYDLTAGGDATLERAVALARRNLADLCLLHVVSGHGETLGLVDERHRMLARVAASIALPPDQVQTVVRHGDKADEILACAERWGADLIVVPDDPGDGFAQLLGTDMAAELMRRAGCPVWIVRQTEDRPYRTIVAAVDAGKADAARCPATRRVLELASSMARLEGAALHILYAWEYAGRERETMASELPAVVRAEKSNHDRLRHLHVVSQLVRDVLGEPIPGTPVAVRGSPVSVIPDYLNAMQADMLVMEGRAGRPLMNAFTGNGSLSVLRQAGCSVLLSRPPAAGAVRAVADRPSAYTADLVA